MNQTAVAINPTELTSESQRSWIANLNLTFSSTEQGSRLSSVERNGPLSVQKAFYPEGPDCAHVYLLHPPAGIVSGDELHLSARLNAASHALLTTPGANRFYRAREDASLGTSLQLQKTHYQLAEHAILEHLPQETLIYSGADAINQLMVEMSADSMYFGWDIISLGLPAVDKPFVQGAFTQKTQLLIDGKLAFHDVLKVNQQNGLLHHVAGLRGHSIVGTFLIAAPAQLSSDKNQQKCSELLDIFRQKVEQLNACREISISALDGVFVIRYLGQRSSRCKFLFAAIWQLARLHLCQLAAHQPRIWLT
ncbi:urease accessory protein UreD [Catenovulum sediminis]|uniref:Urease accessory protein UreD n=1 Tax=Catenovulum sediminis TaxID=1740262 RepID=A0ABV1REC4_9ALTE